MYTRSSTTLLPFPADSRGGDWAVLLPYASRHRLPPGGRKNRFCRGWRGSRAAERCWKDALRWREAPRVAGKPSRRGELSAMHSSFPSEKEIVQVQALRRTSLSCSRRVANRNGFCRKTELAGSSASENPSA